MKNDRKDCDVVVLGAGAAGMMAAAQAGQTGARVILLDHADEPGRKILISGGGRCNFTNLEARDSTYLSQNPRFVRSALAQFTPAMFCDLVRNHHIRWEEKERGQLFCQNSARDIVDLLVAECRRGQVKFELNCRILSVRRDESGFEVQTAHGFVRTKAMILATGGLTIPKLGATDLSLRIARQFDLAIIQPAPALVRLYWDAPILIWRACP